MKKSSFRSLVFTPVLGALFLNLLGCAAEPLPDEEETSSTTAALISRAAAAGATDTATSAASARTSKTAAAASVITAAAPVPSDATIIAPATTPTSGGSSNTSDLESSHPWAVRISGTGGLDCRGSLIHPSWVLTAAHCIGTIAGQVSYTRTDPTTGAVSQGSRLFDVNGKSRGMFVHPGYVADSGFGQPQNDIALIRLATPFTIDRNLQTVALPRSPANPGRTGTIATNNHGAALPAGMTAVLRAPQTATADCAAPQGFICIDPPATSLCKGDSGSGFIETLGGRATLVGITSNVSGTDDCIAAGGQAELSDVYAYRDWILGTMGMSLEQVAGRVRLRRAGSASSGIMSLQCLSTGAPAVEVPMTVPGGEIAIDCDDARVFCQPQGAGLSLNGFSLLTYAPDGSTSVQALPYLSSFTAAYADPGSSFQQYTCSVGGLTATVTAATAAFATF